MTTYGHFGNMKLFSLSEPEEGYALETDFRVSCSGWNDRDMPLSYKFAYKTSETDFESLIYFGSKSETPPIKLPLGKPSLNYSIMVIIDTADSFLAANISVLNVTVSFLSVLLKIVENTNTLQAVIWSNVCLSKHPSKTSEPSFT